jgi:tRNA isopentenyl-2-thiomethyl-A-37 hydroxylase MiaE
MLRDELGAMDHELAPLYAELFAAEAKHYADLVELAALVMGGEASARSRLLELAAIEAVIVRGLSGTAAIHG